MYALIMLMWVMAKVLVKLLIECLIVTANIDIPGNVMANLYHVAPLWGIFNSAVCSQ